MSPTGFSSALTVLALRMALVVSLAIATACGRSPAEEPQEMDMGPMSRSRLLRRR
jgi:hypothetical protein